MPASNSLDKTEIKPLVVMATFFERKKPKCQIDRNSPDTENLAKIGPVDFEIIGLTGIVIKETAAELTANCACFQQPGGLK